MKYNERMIRTRSGFTLIELLVVLGILSILSGSLILYNHTTRQQVALYTEEAKLVQIISRAKSLSLSTYRESSSAQVCGYGVHVDYGRMTYALFSYDRGRCPVQCKNISAIDYGSCGNEMVSYPLSRELTLLASPPAGGFRIDDVLFVPPDPTTLINSGGVLIQSGSGVIVLQTQNGSALSTITVNSNGQVTF